MDTLKVRTFEFSLRKVSVTKREKRPNRHYTFQMERKSFKDMYDLRVIYQYDGNTCSHLVGSIDRQCYLPRSCTN